MSESRVVACLSCGQKNRVRVAATGVPHCQKCGAALPWLADLSSSEFQAGVVDSPIPVLADFWAPWCGPCRMVSPAVEKMASEFAGKIKVAKVNTDEQPELGQRFGVRSIPTLIMFEAGREKSRAIGARSASELRGWVEQNLGAGHRS